jgi:hypothetical protein
MDPVRSALHLTKQQAELDTAVLGPVDSVSAYEVVRLTPSTSHCGPT